MMTVLVTGATGFIGRCVVAALLEKEYKVVALTRNSLNKLVAHDNLTIINGDMTDLENLTRKVAAHVPTACIHLAWEGIPDFSQALCRKNLNYGLDVLEFCKAIGITTVISMGSCFEYKNPVQAVSEDAKLSCENSFKAAKNALRIMSEAFCQENNMDFYWLRLFYVYGPGQRSNSLIPYIINSIQNGQQPNLKGAYNANDFVYVEDVADAVLKVLSAKPNQKVLNVGNGKATRVLDILEIIARKMDYVLNTGLYEKNQLTSNFWADLTAVTDNTGWVAKTPLELGIEKTIKHFCEMDNQ